jgi:arylsulfatase
MLTNRSRIPVTYACLVTVALLLTPTGCSSRSSVESESTEQSAAQSKPVDQNVKRPHVLVVLIDTLRADRLGCYGDQRGLTPTMDAWAAEGVVFERAVSPSPWTLPSLASFFTATYPPVHKANSSRYAMPGVPREQKVTIQGIPENLPLLTEDLAKAGYVGIGQTTNHFLRGGYGFRRGFDQWKFIGFAWTHRGQHLNKAAFQWLQAAQYTSPHFIYLHYMDPHEPYWSEEKHIAPRIAELPDPSQMRPVDNPKRSLYRRSLQLYGKDDQRQLQLARYVEYWQARYDAGIGQVDDALARLQQEFESLGLWDDMFVILTADHGEALGEHDTWSHGDETLQVELDIPLIMRWPGHFPAGKRIKTRVSLIDVMPTVCEAVRVDVTHRIQGRSVLPLITSDDETKTELGNVPLFASGVQRRPQEFAVIFDNQKLRYDPSNDLLAYHLLDEDPIENDNRADEFPAEVEKLKHLIAEHIAESASLASGLSGNTGTLTPEELEVLKSLGYLGGGDD